LDGIASAARTVPRGLCPVIAKIVVVLRIGCFQTLERIVREIAKPAPEPVKATRKKGS
jgi:hypothetical protein